MTFSVCSRISIVGLILVLGVLRSTDAAQDHVDAELASALGALKQELTRRDPAHVAARAVVANFSEEGVPWGTPLAAYLQERAAWLVENRGLFKPPAVARTRGITIKQIAGVVAPNDPKALTGFYGSELAIEGFYRREGDRAVVRLVAVDDQGRTLAESKGEIPMEAVPQAVAAVQINGEHTSQLLGALTLLGPRMQGQWRVDITTPRPGTGASFRQGETIQYFVNSTMDGYLYLFHVDTDRNVIRIFPNQHQPDARVRAGVPVEVPAPGAPFRFEASAPFGLETTFAVVTPSPLDEKDFQPSGEGFTAPSREVPTLVTATRNVGHHQSGTPSANRPIIWNSITILIRP